MSVARMSMTLRHSCSHAERPRGGSREWLDSIAAAMRECRRHGALVALGLVLVAPLVASAAAATLSWSRRQALHVLPASAPNDDVASLGALACLSLRSCAAVGDFGYDLHTDPSTSVTEVEALNES